MDDIPLTIGGGQIRVKTGAFVEWLAAQRWFGGKSRVIRSLDIIATLEISPGIVAAIQVNFTGGATELYGVPLMIVQAPVNSEGVIERLTGDTVLMDATFDEGFRKALPGLLLRNPECGLKFSGANHSRLLPAIQSNTAIVYDERIFLKIFRKLLPGINPDEEISRHLGTVGFPNTPRFIGVIHWDIHGVGVCTLAVSQELIANASNGWNWAVDHAKAAFEGMSDARFIEKVEMLGARTAEMHRALTSSEPDPAFAPEPFTAEDANRIRIALTDELGNLPPLLAQHLNHRNESIHLETLQSIKSATQWLHAAALAVGDDRGLKIRIHGDYHLGQLLVGADGVFFITDFEGEPARSFEERREKQSPLRDVAGMTRSFDYAAQSAAQVHGDSRAADWSRLAQKAFLNGWRKTLLGSNLLPASESDLNNLLRLFLLQKLLYEIQYEFRNRPDWIGIPLRGLQEFCRTES